MKILKKTVSLLNFLVFSALLSGLNSVCANAQTKNLGMVGIKSVYGHYLQAHSDNGETHASNDSRNTEETWFLISVDSANHIYALENWSNGKFLTKSGSCAYATSTVLGTAQEWRMISGKPWNVLNAVGFVSVADNTVLAANDAGNNSPYCGGEVEAVAGWGGHNPDIDGSGWRGWWVMSPATTPQPGKDFWNTVGNAVGGVANQITPADVVSVLAAL